jgi:hypothetical protein
MRMRRLRMLPILMSGLLVSLSADPASAQHAPGPVPYHMLLGAQQRAATGVRAQTPYVPYFGKNRVRYDKFDWQIYQTDHFNMYYYPELEPHLERIAGYAESAYATISADLKYDLAERVPLLLFTTQSEFQEQNIAGELPEGVLAFAEPERNRMVLPIDEPPDQLYRLITHELTHVFEFEIVPRGLAGGLPLWVDEGLANYMAGYWNVLDLMQVRDAALSDNVPRMSEFESQPLSGRLPYSLGHATFEFIESRWGKEGLRQFLFSLRKNVLGGSESAYMEALKLEPEDFDEQFERYLKERFRPFRDKERPADYGSNIARTLERTKYVTVLSIEPSPSGDILAAVVGNADDQELDILLLSAKDGEIIPNGNLTKGFDKDRGFEYIGTTGGLRGNLVPWITWAPVGDRIAYFARTEKDKTLIIHNVVSKRIERRIKLSEVDGPESPAFSPDGRKVAFAAIAGGITDIYAVDIESGTLENLTKDATADYAPTYSPDGRSIVYTARPGGNDKLFRLDLASRQRRQLTFGAHDDTGAKFYNDHTIVFTSTAIDPSVDVTPEVARNANIPNVWTLDLNNGELRQWTDAATGVVSPVVLRQTDALRVAFVSYHKGVNGIHAITGEKPIATVASDDFGGPGPIFEFTAPLSHTLVRDNIRKKRWNEGLRMSGRPPVNLGVNSSGTIYGDTQITFTDVLGDQEISFYARSVQQYRTTAFTYINLTKRWQFALQGFSQDLFYYGQLEGALYDPYLAPFIDRDLAESVQSQRGGTAFVIYPFNRYSRVELFSGYINLKESYTNDVLQEQAIQFQQEQFGQSLLRSGHMVPFGVSFVNETTVFRDYGPVAGRTLKLSYDGSPSFGDSWLSRNTLDLDYRHYSRIAANGVLATRVRGFKSWGRNPDFMYFGGNSELRGYEYLEFIGQKGFFANAELRFPLIEAMLTPIGVLGGLRGVFFANIGGAGANNTPFKLLTSKGGTVAALNGYDIDAFGNLAPTFDPPQAISGIRLLDARASYGIGLQSFMLGFPMHFDWSWKTMFNKSYEDLLFRSCAQTSFARVECGPDGNSFRNVKFDFWIGYDF